MHFNTLDKKSLFEFISQRSGEKKLGESLFVGSDYGMAELKDCPAKYVLLGIPEDIGPRANYGQAGARSAWTAFLGKFLNMQSNAYLSGEEVLLLGAFSFEALELNEEKREQNSRIVAELDVAVSLLIEHIVQADKIPIVIGGGHNNAYGLLKGSSMALKQAIQVCNLDPHADYRPLEGRHSGNGFSYAQADGFLGAYHVLALHEAYNSAEMLARMKADGKSYQSFESIFLRGEFSFEEAVREAKKIVSKQAFGIELDLDSVQDFPSSAQTPSGITPNQARYYVHHLAQSKNVCYFHLAEAAPDLVSGSSGQVGKLLAYLVSDFIKAQNKM